MRVVCLFVLMCCQVLAETELVVPWVTNNAQFRSKIVINNLNAVRADVTLKATRADGQSEQVSLQIEAMDQFVADVRNLFVALGEGTGYAVHMESETDMLQAAFIVSGTASSSGDSPGQSNVVPPSAASRILLFAYTPSSDTVNSAPVIVNGASVAATVTFHAYQNGQRFSAEPIQVPAGFTPFASLVATLFPDLSGDLFLVAESDQPILGTVFIFNANGEPAMANAVALSSVPQTQQKADLLLTNAAIYSLN